MAKTHDAPIKDEGEPIKKPRPTTCATVPVDRFRLMTVGIFLFFILGGVLAPSTAKAVPFDFSVNLDSTVCGFTCTGTLFFTFDGTHVTFDTDKLLNLQIDGGWNSYLLAPSAPGTLFASSINSNYINIRTAYHSPPSWVLYSRLQIYLESPRNQIYSPYTGPIINPDPFALFNLEFIEALGDGTAAYVEVGGIRTTHVAPQASGIPEPSSLLMLGFGLAGLVLWRRKHTA